MVKYQQDKLSIVFQALSDPTRRQILKKLTLGNPSVVELARPFQISLPAVSKHLKVLESAGLIERKRQGRKHYFDVITKPIDDADQWIAAYKTYWNERLVALEKYIESHKGRINKRR